MYSRARTQKKPAPSKPHVSTQQKPGTKVLHRYGSTSSAPFFQPTSTVPVDTAKTSFFAGRTQSNQQTKTGVSPDKTAFGSMLIQRQETKSSSATDERSSRKAFTKDEKKWISEVLKSQYIQLVLNSYTLPNPVLNRVTEIKGRSSAKGTFFPTHNDVELSDTIYNAKEKHSIPGLSFKETNEESFKGTLIHEIFHYLEHNSQKIAADPQKNKKILTPAHLIAFMAKPTAIGLPEYAFGWFIHPKSKFVLHFQLPEIMALGGSGDISILNHPDLLKIRKDKQWEASPLPRSGQSISVEEDLAESFSLALTSKRTRKVLETKYPNRYKLLSRYIGVLSNLRKKGKVTK